MQENNNFESIIRTWRRLSGELVETESTALTSMSGDSHTNQPQKPKEESDLLVPERPRPLLGPAVAGATIAASDTTESKEEKKELINNKDAAGDTNENDQKDDKDNNSEKDYLEDKGSIMDKSADNNWPSDKVDSVFLRQPPPHKVRVRSSSTSVEDEDCGIKCLYYTLQCCDCVLM